MKLLRFLITIFLLKASVVFATCINTYQITTDGFGSITVNDGDCYEVHAGVSSILDPNDRVFGLGTSPSNISAVGTITNNGNIGSNTVAGLYPIDYAGHLVLNNTGNITGTNGLTINAWAGLTIYNSGHITADSSFGVNWTSNIFSNNTIWGYPTLTPIATDTYIENDGGTISSPGNTTANINIYGGGILTIRNINDGVISAGDASVAIDNASSSSGSAIYNSGTISVGNAPLNANDGWWGDGIAAAIYNHGQDAGYSGSNGIIDVITNVGSITSGTGAYGIYNLGILGTLNNLQGAGNANGALIYGGVLPNQYNVIINSTSEYGQLKATNATGNMVFNIYGNSGTTLITGVNASVVTNYRYLNVLQGFTSISSISGITGTYNGYSYSLVAGSLAGEWDLLVAGVSGPSSVDTQSSLRSLASTLRSGFSGQAIATNFANMNTYDCDLFDSKGVCVSVGGQQTYVDNPSSNLTSTVVVAGYKVSPQIRIGGFLNQNINNNTVSGVHMSNANPLMGLFAVWNQNENRLGYQVKVANAYQDKDVTTTRDIIGTSEAGTGKTNLNTQSYVGELSYAFLANEDKTLVRPYAAIRYTRIKQDGYTEDSSVTAPLTYAALEDRSTAALVGVKLNHKLAEKVRLTGSLGIEQDLYHHVDNLTATGVSGLTSENFNDNIKRTRPVASIGAYYMPAKNQRIAADLYYQQLPFQSTGSTTAYVNYTIGF